MTFPGACAVEVAGDPPGKIHEYWDALEVVLKDTGLPAATVTFEAGDAIVPRGGLVPKSES